MRHFTLHLRLTKGCNADCGYCSSWEAGEGGHMTLPQATAALDFIVDRVLPLLGHARPDRNHATLQYLGGEILTVPRDVLKGTVLYARRRFAERFTHIQDGCQTNLIGSPERVTFLATLFGPRIGTSIDSFGTVRTVGGSAERYRAIAAARRADLARRRGIVPSAVFVLDRAGLAHAEAELARAEAGGYGLTFRPVFRGGREVEAASVAELAAGHVALFRAWALRATVPVEPFLRLLAGRAGWQPESVAGCPFQRDCAEVSLALDPDGALYVCQDMADSGQFPLGNALTGAFDEVVWARLRARRDHLDARCAVCPWASTCHGGCMSEAVHATGDPWARTELCDVWTALFQEIDTVLATEGAGRVRAWLDTLMGARRAGVTGPSADPVAA